LACGPNQANTNRVGALPGLIAYYQHRPLNYRNILDTALVVANQAAGLSQQLGYEGPQQEALFQQGKIVIKQEKLDKIKRMLSSMSGVFHIRSLSELGFNERRFNEADDYRPLPLHFT
jgi:hypothetical protein